MPKKMGVNSKAEAARERRSAEESDRRQKAERAKEEEYWREAEGSKSRAARRREEEAEKKAEAAARKAENRRLAELEEAAAASATSKTDARKANRVGAPPPKVTEAELVRRREEERLRLEREAEAVKKRAARVNEEEEYERVVLVANTNRDDSLVEAIARMPLVNSEAPLPADRHPERCLKASFKNLMESSISDYFGDSNSYRSCQNVNNGTDYSTESNEFVYPRKSGTVERYQLVEEHGTLSRAFLYEASVPRYRQYAENLQQKLKFSKEIWSQLEREACIECLFCCDEFRKDVLDIVEFFGNELKMCMDGTPPKVQIDLIRPSTLTCLRSFIIPLVLKLLRSVHALWTADAMVTMPSELKEAKIKQNFAQISCSSEDTAKLLDTDVAKLKENDIGQWLQVIRERGYNLLGLCAHIQGSFSELLGSSSINDAIMENLGCMEFRHVSKLIDLVLIPLLKYCPHKLLGERILKLLPPLFKYYCEDIFCCAWFDLLNTGRVGYRHYFGYPQGSEESVQKLEGYILLDLTRKVSKLLGVLASLDPKDALMCVDLQPVSTVKTAPCDSKCASSNSVVGYALRNNCFGMLKMNLLGSWVDGEATLDAVPFFHALVQVAVATNNRKVRRFFVDDMLPATIKRLCDDLPCAVQRTIGKFSSELNSSKSKKASEVLLVLCEEIYKVYVESQDFTSQDLDNENIGDRFKDWFARQTKDLLAKASCTIPKHFPDNLWNWEFEDEFQRYLPTYIDILYEVDAMDCCPEYDYSCSSTLIEKLRPEFRLKHDINSRLDRHVRMIDKMVQRKLVAEYPKRRFHQMDKWLCKLITTKPYLKNSYDRNRAVALLMEDLTKDAKLSHLDVLDVVDMFYNAILFCLEPQFHPLIREGHKNFLIEIAHQFIFAENTNCYEPLEPESEDFPGYLQPHASSYIYRMKIESKYSEAREQVCLHQEFDKYLAAGELDDYIYMFNSSQDKSVQEFSDKHLARNQFGKLNSKLIRLSLQERAQIVDMQRQIDTYSENLRNILANANELKDCLENLMNELEEEGFFDVDNDSTDWGKTRFISLIEKFKKLVFKGHCCPQYVAVQGIMEYWRISKRSDIAAQVDLEKVVEVACSRWKQNIAELWTDTRYYEESCYDFIRNPLKKIFPRKGELQNYDKPPTMVG